MRNRFLVPTLVAGLLVVSLAVGCTPGEQVSTSTSASRGPASEPIRSRRVSIKSNDFGQFASSPDILVAGGWGAADGEFGLLSPEGEGSREGPMSFAVDRQGVIYVLDQVNGRVQVFDSRGQRVGVVRIVQRTADNLAVDNHGALYVFDIWTGHKLAVYRKGRLVQERPIASDLAAISEVFAVGGDIFVEDDSTGNLYRVATSRGILPPESQRQVALPGRPAGLPNRFVRLSGRTATTAYIIVSDADGDPKMGITVHSRRELSPDATGADDNGNLYLVSQVVRKAGLESVAAQFSILRLTSDGVNSGELDVPIAQYAPSRRPFFIGANGDVYQMQSDKDGLSIVRWQVQ